MLPSHQDSLEIGRSRSAFPLSSIVVGEKSEKAHVWQMCRCCRTLWALSTASRDGTDV
jgi:hypothetical protein